MKADALQLILDTAKRANDTQILNIPTDGRIKWVRVGDDIRAISVDPTPRNHGVFSLPTLIDYVKSLPDPSNAVVWHGFFDVTLVINDNDRRDKAKFGIEFSKRYKLLQALESGKDWFDQYQFVRLLRLELGLDNIGVVSKFRKLVWADGSTTSGEFRHGADKMGKTINAQVENAADLPDELEIYIPVYNEFPGEMLAVRCAIEIDSRNQRLQIVPLPGELKRVLDATQEMIHDWLARELTVCGTAIYYGSL